MPMFCLKVKEVAQKDVAVLDAKTLKMSQRHILLEEMSLDLGPIAKP